jgi:arylsulfatase A-like enzyme
VDQLIWHRIPRFSAQPPARRLTDVAIDALERESDRPFFLYVHYFEPHWPYFPPRAEALRYGAPPDGNTAVNFIDAYDVSRGTLIFHNPFPESENEKARRLYRGEIDDTLSEIQRLFAKLEGLGHRRDTIVVFTADHGHSLGQHGYYFHHGAFLYDDSIRIPLVIRWPGHIPAGRVVTTQVRSIDVAPTLLHLAGVSGQGKLDGRGLESLWREAPGRDRPALLESDILMFLENSRRDVPGVVGKLRALRTSRFKLILTPHRGPFQLELFDLEADPGELVNLATDPGHRQDLTELSKQLWLAIPPAEREALLALEAGTAASEGPRGSDSDVEQLRSLGYVN